MSWRLWDVETTTELLLQDAKTFVSLHAAMLFGAMCSCNSLQEGHSRPVYGCSVHPDGSLVATSDLGGVVRA